MTLIEALAGTAVLATVLVSILIADARLRKQAHRSESRSQACEMAESLLAKFWEKPEEFPRTASGDIPGHPGWTWRTQPVKNDAADAMNSQVVVLEIFAPQLASQSPVVRVEVLLSEKSL